MNAKRANMCWRLPQLWIRWRKFERQLWVILWSLTPGNTKGGSITVTLTSCLTDLESAVWQLTIFVFICKTDYSKPVKQEVNSTEILPPLVFPAYTMDELKLTGQNLGRVFNFKCGRVCLYHAVAFIIKTAKLKVENSAQTTFRFSPISFFTPR